MGREYFISAKDVFVFKPPSKKSIHKSLCVNSRSGRKQTSSSSNNFEIEMKVSPWTRCPQALVQSRMYRVYKLLTSLTDAWQYCNFTVSDPNLKHNLIIMCAFVCLFIYLFYLNRKTIFKYCLVCLGFF